MMSSSPLFYFLLCLCAVVCAPSIIAYAASMKLLSDDGAVAFGAAQDTVLQRTGANELSLAGGSLKVSKLQVTDPAGELQFGVDADTTLRRTAANTMSFGDAGVVHAGLIGVGVGVTAPTERMHINGNLKVTGNIIVNGVVDGVDVSTLSGGGGSTVVLSHTLVSTVTAGLPHVHIMVPLLDIDSAGATMFGGRKLTPVSTAVSSSSGGTGDSAITPAGDFWQSGLDTANEEWIQLNFATAVVASSFSCVYVNGRTGSGEFQALSGSTWVTLSTLANSGSSASGGWGQSWNTITTTPAAYTSFRMYSTPVPYINYAYIQVYGFE